MNRAHVSELLSEQGGDPREIIDHFGSSVASLEEETSMVRRRMLYFELTRPIFADRLTALIVETTPSGDTDLTEFCATQ